LTQQHNAQPASVSSAYAHYYYTRNGLGKIVTEEKRGAAFDAYTCGGTYTGGLVAAYEYSPRGELIEAQTRYLAPSQYGAAPAGDMLAGRSWEYEFDDTGNLLRKSLIDDTWYCVSDFGADNSIQTRTTTAGALVDGAAAAGARVYVGGAKQSPAASQTSLTRNGLGTYFYMVVPYATGSAGVYDDGIFTVAEKSGQVAFAQRDAYVPNSLLKKSRHAPQQAICAFQQGGITGAGSMTLPVMPTPLETQIAVAHRVAVQDASRGVSFGRQGVQPSLSKAALRKRRLGLQRRTPGPFSADC